MTKAEIQLVRSLGDKRAREEAGLFVAEGEKLVGELLASGLRVRKVYHTTESLVAPMSLDAEPVTPKDMARASHLKTPTDCLALVEIPHRELHPAALADELTLALDGVQNPGNVGTIIRLADWFGIRNVLCSPDCADCWSPKVVQATMGAITRVAVHYGDLGTMIGALGAAPAIPVYGAFLEGADIYRTPLSPVGVIVLGSEGRGVSASVARLVTQKIFIPPAGAAAVSTKESTSVPTGGSAPLPTSESLNVAIAAAIICSEFRRPR